MLTSAHHDRTNVLWITVCTLRSDHLGAYGYSKPVSPKLDDLAKRSFLFERTLTQAPWTRPSIASMVTSIYPRSLAIDGSDPEEIELGLNDSFRTAAEYFHDADYYTIGITANPNTNPSRNFDQGYDFYIGTKKLWRKGYGRHKADARVVSAQLLDHLNGPAKGRKFFAHLVLVDVHAPYIKREDFGPNQEPIIGITIERYDEQIRFMDEILARLFSKLNEMGLEDTLIVFNADHGEGFREAGVDDAAHGPMLFNSTLWVPFILYHPSFESRARRISEQVESVDVLPTVMDLLQLPFDSDAFDGRSHAGSLLGDAKIETRDFSVVETNYRSGKKSAILQQGLKLVVDYRPPNMEAKPGAKTYRLFRYKTDVYEKVNLASRESKRVTAMFRRLTTWQKERDALKPDDILKAKISDSELEALRMLGYVDEGVEK
jgi:arylsulfatase A-like enzyme